MRTLTTTTLALLAAVLGLPSAAHAQDPAEAEDVQLTPEPGAAPSAPAPAPEPAPAPAAQPTPAPAPAPAPVQAEASIGVNAQADANAAAPAPAPAPAPMVGSSQAMGSYGGPVTENESEWKFGFAGYFRAPMRIGIGSRKNAAVQPTTPEETAEVDKLSDTTFHNPVIPDDQYLSWQHTRHAQKDWAELFFSYGNSWAKGTVAIQGFQFTDASWVLEMAQFGVSQGWVTLTPYMPWENVRVIAKAGNFWGRYGMAGRYDAGEYDTYLFGRTHVMGEDVRVEIDSEDSTLGLEQGFGTRQPDPSVYNTARFTLLHHEHVDWALQGLINLKLSAHFLHAFAQSEVPLIDPQPNWVEGEENVKYRSPGQPNGSLMIYGLDGHFDFGQFGHLYAGFSRVSAKDAVTVSSAVEVIHSYGGGEFTLGITDNYLDSYQCRSGIDPTTCSGGNGAVNTLLGQWDLSANSLAESSLFGEGRDLAIKLYGMFNTIESDDRLQDGTNKLKFGTDLLLDVFPVMAVGLRFDHLRPNSGYSTQNFSVLSPRLVFRSQLVTHEEISLQYSRYFYAQRFCPNGAFSSLIGDLDYSPTLDDIQCTQPATAAVTGGFGAHPLNQDGGDRATTTFVPDLNVIAISGSLWW
jgi:hypothetical protein